MEMMTILNRVAVIKFMDSYIRDVIGDESVTMRWLTYGMPDGSTERDLLFDLEDKETYDEWCNLFIKIVKQY